MYVCVCVFCLYLCRFSGVGDAMAGSVVLNSGSRFYPQFKAYQEQNFIDLVHTAQALYI